uniref:Uncharacterized protein n=1 Tax=Pundamilia nyererei TaxID=303518 RepID=A0A3B4EXG1_9CICH
FKTKPLKSYIMDTLPAHLLPLVMEEFPQSLATACVCRAGQREPRLRCVQCGIIEEEEEDCSTLEEDQALRSFLQTVESLRRTRLRSCKTGEKVNTGDTLPFAWSVLPEFIHTTQAYLLHSFVNSISQ